MKNSLLLIALLFFMGLGLKAQSFSEIGTGTSGTNYPIHFSYKYSWTSFMYTSAEMGEAKTIDKLAIFAAKDFGGWQKDFLNQKIYLTQTTESLVRAGYPDMASGDYTKVYEGTVSYPANGAGWIVIDIEDFEYDGTSNLIMHWENHSGEAYSNLNMFYGTSVDMYSMISNGSDTEFPTTDGRRDYYGYRPNLRVYTPIDPTIPGTPNLVNPSNEGVKVDVDVDITFSLYNTDSYDFYLGTDPNAMIKVVDKESVLADGDYIYTPNDLLLSKIKYYFKIDAYKGDVVSESPIYNFTTQKLIASYPFTCGFEDYTIGTISGQKLSTIISKDSDWTSDNGWKCGWREGGFDEELYMGDGSAFVNLTYSGTASLMTPRINLPENYKLSFAWFKKGNLNSSIHTYLEITTDGGETWTELKEFEDVAGQGYKPESISLSGYSGDNVFIRWRHRHTSYSYSDLSFWLDDIKISEISNEPEVIRSTDKIAFAETCVGSELNQVVTVTNIGLSDLVIRGCSSDGPFTCDFIGTVEPGATQDLEVMYTPTEAGTVAGDIVFDCNIAEGSFSFEVSGSSYLPVAEFTKNFDDGLMPEKWLNIEIPTDQSSYVGVPTQSWYNDPHSGNYSVVMNRASNITTPMFLICEGVRNFDVNRLTFYAKKGLAVVEDYSIEVGVMKNPTDPESFMLMKTITLSQEYQQYSVMFSPDETSPYIAFKQPADNDYTKVYIDDIVWENLSNAKPNAATNGYPVNNKENLNHYMPVELSWQSGGNAPTGYKLQVSTDETFSNLMVDEDFDVSVVSYQLSQNLDFATTYFWRVIPYNVFGDCASPAIWSFTTMADPTVTSLPYYEDFNMVQYVEGEKCMPTGWKIEDVAEDDKSWNVLLADVNKEDMVLGQAAMFADYSTANAKDDYLYTPAFALEQGKKYKFSFKMHTIMHDISSQFYREDIEVLIGSDNNSGAMSSEALVTDFTEDATWKTVEAMIEVSENGNYFIALHAISEVSKYKLIIDEVEMLDVTNSTDIDPAKEGKLLLYPNPTKGTLNYAISNAKVNSIKVYNQLGSVVYSATANDMPSQLNLDFLPNGWYCVEILAGQKSYKKAFIKK